jgi:hypothetical protein
MGEIISNLLETADWGNVIFVVLMAVTLLVMLLTISSIHNKLRLIHTELQSLKKDQSVINDELELLAHFREKGDGAKS